MRRLHRAGGAGVAGRSGGDAGRGQSDGAVGPGRVRGARAGGGFGRGAGAGGLSDCAGRDLSGVRDRRSRAGCGRAAGGARCALGRGGAGRHRPRHLCAGHGGALGTAAAAGGHRPTGAGDQRHTRPRPGGRAAGSRGRAAEAPVSAVGAADRAGLLPCDGTASLPAAASQPGPSDRRGRDADHPVPFHHAGSGLSGPGLPALGPACPLPSRARDEFACRAWRLGRLGLFGAGRAGAADPAARHL